MVACVEASKIKHGFFDQAGLRARARRSRIPAQGLVFGSLLFPILLGLHLSQRHGFSYTTVVEPESLGFAHQTLVREILKLLGLADPAFVPP